MKNLKGVFIVAVVALGLVVITSCNKKNTVKKNLAAQVIGTYKGTLTSGEIKHDGVANVVAFSDTLVQIHCYDYDGFDTTFVMELYENGDSIMLCNTGQDFFNQYGHNMSTQHHMPENMMGNMEGMNADWQQHMKNEHQPGDEHFGSFNMDAKTFDYLFETNDSTQMKIFTGKKK